ncbi:MAG: hypothetical protein Q9N34_00165 [Aquificota bacterium]|nr:hypothetical protein [Aquificota bacterium]
MGRLALLVLVLVALYFTVLEPFLTARRILFGVEGIRLSISPPSLTLKRAYLYLPAFGGYRFFGVEGLEVVYAEKVRIRLEEGILINLRGREGRRSKTATLPGSGAVEGCGY